MKTVDEIVKDLILTAMEDSKIKEEVDKVTESPNINKIIEILMVKVAIGLVNPSTAMKTIGAIMFKVGQIYAKQPTDAEKPEPAKEPAPLES